jgi:hypothetical protein
VVTRADLDAGTESATPVRTPLYANNNPAQNAVSLTFTFANSGPSDAQAVTLALPSELVFDSCNVTSEVLACSTSGGVGHIATVKAGHTIVVNIAAHANPAKGHAPGLVTGLLTVTDSATVGTTTFDYNTGPSGNDTTHNAISLPIATVPAPVPNLAAATGNTNVVLRWGVPANGGATLDSVNPYLITVRIGATVVRTIQVPTSAAQPCFGNAAGVCFNVTGLTNNTTYSFDVQALNAVGLSDASTATAKPNTLASATIIPPATARTLTTCTTATPANPVCIQYIVPSGGGGVAGVQGDFPLSNTFCGGFACNGNGALDLVSPTGFTDVRHPIVEIVTWDLAPNGLNSVIYYQTPHVNGGVPFVLPKCKNGSIAAPNPCLKKLNVLGGKNLPPGANGDLQIQINLTSDIDGLTGRH